MERWSKPSVVGFAHFIALHVDHATVTAVASASPLAKPFSRRDQTIRELGSLGAGTRAGTVQRPEGKSR